jgi:hypothetical protein
MRYQRKSGRDEIGQKGQGGSARKNWVLYAFLSFPIPLLAGQPKFVFVTVNEVPEVFYYARLQRRAIRIPMSHYHILILA